MFLYWFPTTEQLLKFVVSQSAENEVSSSTTIGDNSDSLYQMLQEYIQENQNLKVKKTKVTLIQ